jgi:hypothetical protein
VPGVKSEETTLKKSEQDAFEKLVGQLQSVYDELSVLSKKAPNDGVNKFKLGFLNALLTSANGLLSDRYRPFPDFTQFDIDAVPQNSDVVFILAQYLQYFEKLRADNVVISQGAWYWRVDAAPGEKGDEHGKVLVRTTRPLRLRE